MSERLKIAMVAACPFPYQRGTPVRIFRLAEALSDRGHEVAVVTYHLGDEISGRKFTIHRTRRINSYQICEAGPTYRKIIILDPLLMMKLSEVLQSHNFDFIHAHHYEGLLVSLAARKKRACPIIYDAHTLLGSELPFYNLGLPKKLKRAIGSGLDRWLPKRADHVIAVTEKIRVQLIRDCRVVPGNITVVPNGIERGLFSVATEHEVKPNAKSRTLVYCGSLAPYQGIDLLLKALQKVIVEQQDIRLLIVSQSPFDKYERLAGELGIREHIDVITEGFDRVPRYLAAADLLVNARTDCDGIPQKLLNYMASGKPIVSFEGSATLLSHGETGWVVENGNIPAFAQAILHLLRDSSLSMNLGVNARNYVMAEYSWDKTAQKAEAVYKRMKRLKVRESHPLQSAF